MISKFHAVRMLIHERAQWKTKHHDDFVVGFINGLSWAIACLEQLGKETNEHMKDNPKYVGILARRGY